MQTLLSTIIYRVKDKIFPNYNAYWSHPYTLVDNLFMYLPPCMISEFLKIEVKTPPYYTKDLKTLI